MIEYSRELTGFVLGSGIVIIMFTVWNLFSGHNQIKKTKKSNLSKNINGIMEAWKEEIRIEYLPDRKIKLTFPGEVCAERIVFYLVENEDGTITITDSGEIVQKLDLKKTVNKHAVKKAAWTLDLDYDRHMKAIFVKSDEKQLKDDIWRMYNTLLLLEYARY